MQEESNMVLTPLTLREFVDLDPGDVSQYLKDVADAFQELLSLSQMEDISSVDLNARVEVIRNRVAQRIGEIRRKVGYVA